MAGQSIEEKIVSDLLFDTPWWLFALLGMVAATLMISGNARQNRRLLTAGAAVLALGILLAITSYLVDTPKEKAVKGTHAFIDGIIARDKTKIAAELHPNASIEGWNRQSIIDGAVTYADMYGLQGATITGMTVEQQAPHIIIDMVVFSTHDVAKAQINTIQSEWQLDWLDDGIGHYLLKTITPVELLENEARRNRPPLFLTAHPTSCFQCSRRACSPFKRYGGSELVFSDQSPSHFLTNE